MRCLKCRISGKVNGTKGERAKGERATGRLGDGEKGRLGERAMGRLGDSEIMNYEGRRTGDNQLTTKKAVNAERNILGLRNMECLSERIVDRGNDNYELRGTINNQQTTNN